ncbi:MAG TPA: metalloregulator ArsR/SmtB family transcription factor [Xanthobacteraceae bacterium]
MQSDAQAVSMDALARPADNERKVDRAARAAAFLKALAHQSRLTILCILSEGEKSVSELEDLLSLRQPTVSQQLARLRSDGLVATRRHGKIIYYRHANEESRILVDAIYAMLGNPK